MSAASLMNADDLAGGQRRERAQFIGLSLPATLLILIIVFLPLFWLGSLSFLDRGGAVSLENYQRLTGDLYIDAFIVTFQISAAVTILCVLLGYPLAYWLSRKPQWTANLLLICVLLPFWTAVLVRTYAWLVLLQRNGLINNTLLSIGLIDTPLQLAHNLTASIIGMVHIMLPFLVLPLYASMKSIDGDLVRAAVGLGSSPTEAFWRIFVPMSLPGLFAGVVLVFILSLGFYVTPALLGGGRVQMLAQRIESTITIFSNWGAASALGVVLLLMALALVAILHRVFGLDKLFVR
ncbi:MAG: ABC transporter permease [Methylobacterium sp.]|nr:ABC transporter permease [Methylobacterium sp.]MCA3602786.1 ABC transporter permease [Methylobacterium sp.]MCA3615708.1 ABC transporter permease [Methylobacterium sp.]MCA3643824.1 ABC transporter permease [Methylobacterium sp.]